MSQIMLNYVYKLLVKDKCTRRAVVLRAARAICRASESRVHVSYDLKVAGRVHKAYICNFPA